LRLSTVVRREKLRIIGGVHGEDSDDDDGEDKGRKRRMWWWLEREKNLKEVDSYMLVKELAFLL
jgi:hypothetical protein